MKDVWSWRRTTPQRMLGAPGPTDDQITELMTAAGAAPDHGKLTPWRFLAIRGDARAELGEVFADAQRLREPDAPDEVFDKLRTQPTFAPLILVGIACINPAHPKISSDEQVWAAATALQNVLLCATQQGFGSKWSTGWLAENTFIRNALSVDENERILGFLHIGTRQRTLSDEPVRRPATLREWRVNAGNEA